MADEWLLEGVDIFVNTFPTDDANVNVGKPRGTVVP